MQSKRYQRLKEAGLCTLCGKIPARPGRVQCEACAAQSNAESKLRRKRLVEARRCAQCGKPVEDYYTLCNACRIKHGKGRKKL